MIAPAAVVGTARAEMRCISRFGATQALDDVSLDLLPGEIHALVGENGAGKSTLVKILAGVHQPDAGSIHLDGELAELRGPDHARSLGIAVVHQEPRLFPDLSVAENVYIGHAPSSRLRTIDWGEMRRQAAALFTELDVRFDVGAQVRGLSMADQQLIEIAKALSVEARVLILDEPTASLAAHEVERLTTIVRRLRARRGHPLRQPPARRVFDLCDRATVFRDKHVITTETSRRRRRLVRPWSVGPSRSSPGRNPIGGRPGAGLTRSASSATSASRSGPGRSWASQGWSAPAAPRSLGSSSGSTGRTPGLSASTARRSRSTVLRRPWTPASPTCPRIGTRRAWSRTSPSPRT
jgi:ABC-type branched-subunit amino acid transport system ATPase component